MDRFGSAAGKDNLIELLMNDAESENASDFIIRAFEQSVGPAPIILPRVEHLAFSFPLVDRPADQFVSPPVGERLENDILDNLVGEDIYSDSEDMGIYWEDPTQEDETVPENVNDTSIEILEEDTIPLSSVLNENMPGEYEAHDEDNGIETIDLTGEDADNDTNRFSFNSSNTLRNHYDLANDNQNMLINRESDDENNGIETIDLTGDVPVHELADENPMETALDIENRENVRDSDNTASPIRYRTVTTILMLPGGERKFITSEEPELNLL